MGAGVSLRGRGRMQGVTLGKTRGAWVELCLGAADAAEGRLVPRSPGRALNSMVLKDVAFSSKDALYTRRPRLLCSMHSVEEEGSGAGGGMEGQSRPEVPPHVMGPRVDAAPAHSPPMSLPLEARYEFRFCRLVDANGAPTCTDKEEEGRMEAGA